MDCTKTFTITHHGGATGVTGSCHRLTLHGGEALLVDCGMFQGAELSGGPESATAIDFPLDDVKALLVTHCHIDHVGRIPYLMAKGFDKPIYCTEATAYLLPLVIEDAVKLGISRDEKLITLVLKRLKQLLRPIPYKEWFTIEGMPDLRCKFQVAGHILGSAYIECDLKGYPSKHSPKSHRVVFSGDLGAPYSPLLPAPKSPYRADTLVIESTYGDRLHEGRRTRRQRLKAIIERSLKNGGTVLIPAFSIGRTQELLYELEETIHREQKKSGANAARWQNLSIIVDSPLAAEFTQHYRQLSNLWDAEARTKKQQGRHPLAFEQLITLESHAEHNRVVQHLSESGQPAIVIAASGMCSGGRIINYLKALLPDLRTDLLFVGYQAEGTPGRDIQEWGPKGGYVMLDDEKVWIKASVHTLSGYSAHADQKDLVNFVKQMRYKPEQLRVVHGDIESKTALANEFTQNYGIRAVLPE